MRELRRLLAEETAQGLTEYAIVVGSIVFAAIITFLALGSQLRGYFTSLNDDLNQVPTS